MMMNSVVIKKYPKALGVFERLQNRHWKPALGKTGPGKIGFIWVMICIAQGEHLDDENPCLYIHT